MSKIAPAAVKNKQGDQGFSLVSVGFDHLVQGRNFLDNVFIEPVHAVIAF
jgi:hypothetical protein